MLMGESDQSVAPLAEQMEAVRPFVPDGVPFMACPIPSKVLLCGIIYRSQEILIILLWYCCTFKQARKWLGARASSKAVDVEEAIACFGTFLFLELLVL